MTDTSRRRDMPGRLLRLLSLLQARRTWSGADLAQRLGITDRTLRRDIDRLRALDYLVESATGITGGYRLASCCHDGEVLAFDYSDRSGQVSHRRVEPHHLVTIAGRWYLIAWDPDRDDWRTFRVDRIDRPSRTHRHFIPRELPTPDAASYLTQSFAGASYRYTASVTVTLPAETVRAGLFATIPGDIEVHGPEECTVRLSADSVELVLQFIAAIAVLGAPITLDAPEEILNRVHKLGLLLAT